MATVQIQRRKWKKGISYPIYYKDPQTGKKKYYKTFPKFKEAQRAANSLRSLLDTGKHPEKKKKLLKTMTFEQVGESLKAEWGVRFLQGNLSKKTLSDYIIWLNVLNRSFRGRLLFEFSSDEIQKYVNEVASRHTVLAANKYLFIFKKVFEHGLKLDAVVDNPIDALRMFNEKGHERKEFLLPDELDRLIGGTQSNRGKFYMPAIIYLGAEHGACKQEILDLRWHHINFDFAERGIIRLFRTKNKRERVEFLMPRTKQALLSWRNHLRKKRKRDKVSEIKSDFVFCKIDGRPVTRFDKAWKASLAAAGITNFHFHDLRHTFCSNLILSGAGLKDVKEMIGHKDISMTDRYSHLTLAYKLQKQDQLADHYKNGATKVGVI